MSKSAVLITGGTGLIGTALTDLMTSRNYRVHILSRYPESTAHSAVKQFYWNPAKNEIDANVLKGVSGVVHLAGAGIADKRWTKRRKQEIISSRRNSARLLKEAMVKSGGSFKFFISASGANYYGTETTENIFKESDGAGTGFLSEVCEIWEKESHENNPAQRIAVVRTVMVLSNKGGALPKLAATVKPGIGAVLGSGKQYSPWIHIDDLCEIYFTIAVDDSMHGPYNAVADEPVSHAEMMHAIAAAYRTKIRLPNIPAWALKIALGEMSDMLLKGSRLSNQKLHDAGLAFQFPTLKPALDALIRTP